MLQNIVLRRIQKDFKVIIAMIYFDIVFILFQNGRIVYSRFKIFLNVIVQDFYYMIKSFDLIELLITIKLNF